MLYFIVVTIFYIFAYMVENRVETRLLRKHTTDETSWLAFLAFVVIWTPGILSPMIFEYQSDPVFTMATLYVEQPDGSVKRPLLGVFHKPFTSETERRSFRFSPGPHADSGREVFLVSSHLGETRTLSFRMTWQYALDPGEYRRLQKTGEIDRVLDGFDSKLTLQAFQLMEEKPGVIRNLLFPVSGSQGARLEETVCGVIPRFMREHLVTPAPWIEVGEPFNCWLSTLK